MTFQPGHQHARKPKLFERALKMEIAAAGDDLKALREIARAQIEKAMAGELKSAEFIADRIDGKVPQAVHHGQDEDADPLRIGVYDDRDIVRRLAFMMLAPKETVEDV